jgi:Acyl-protein synthetase, LuxE
MQQLEEEIDKLLAIPPYSLSPDEKHSALLALFRGELEFGGQRHPGYRSYIEHWPTDYRSAGRIADLPYIPVGVLKANPPLSFIDASQVKKTLTSSATTSQMPSRVVLDAPTSRRMTKGVVTIVRDYIGSSRRPYLVVDSLEDTRRGDAMGARSAAIQGLNPFASSTTYCLNVDDKGELALDLQKLRDFVSSLALGGEVLIYGFTYILWNHFVRPLTAEGICLNLPNVRILHSGGWKRLQDQAVEKAVFNRELARVVGCPEESIVDFYGMVESVGVIFPDCPQGNKHSPTFGDVIVRDPLTLEPVAAGQHGIVQVCSILPTSFPGNLILTEDMAQVISYDGCACGRRGINFRFAGRIPKAEIRGCGNIQNKRVAIN